MKKALLVIGAILSGVLLLWQVYWAGWRQAKSSTEDFE